MMPKLSPKSGHKIHFKKQLKGMDLPEHVRMLQVPFWFYRHLDHQTLQCYITASNRRVEEMDLHYYLSKFTGIVTFWCVSHKSYWTHVPFIVSRYFMQKYKCMELLFRKKLKTQRQHHIQMIITLPAALPASFILLTHIFTCMHTQTASQNIHKNFLSQ